MANSYMLSVLPLYVQEDSCPDYMIKAEDCLKQEEERVTNYLHMDTKPKLLKEVEQEILEHYEQELLEKEHSGAAALMRDDKVCPARLISPPRLPYVYTQQAFSPVDWKGCMMHQEACRMQDHVATNQCCSSVMRRTKTRL